MVIQRVDFTRGKLCRVSVKLSVYYVQIKRLYQLLRVNSLLLQDVA